MLTFLALYAYGVSKNGLLQLMSHNFTNSQHLLIIFCSRERELIQFSIDMIKNRYKKYKRYKLA